MSWPGPEKGRVEKATLDTQNQVKEETVEETGSSKDERPPIPVKCSGEEQETVSSEEEELYIRKPSDKDLPSTEFLAETAEKATWTVVMSRRAGERPKNTTTDYTQRVTNVVTRDRGEGSKNTAESTQSYTAESTQSGTNVLEGLHLTGKSSTTPNKDVFDKRNIEFRSPSVHNTISPFIDRDPLVHPVSLYLYLKRQHNSPKGLLCIDLGDVCSFAVSVDFEEIICLSSIARGEGRDKLCEEVKNWIDEYHVGGIVFGNTHDFLNGIPDLKVHHRTTKSADVARFIYQLVNRDVDVKVTFWKDFMAYEMMKSWCENDIFPKSLKDVIKENAGKKYASLILQTYLGYMNRNH